MSVATGGNLLAPAPCVVSVSIHRAMKPYHSHPGRILDIPDGDMGSAFNLTYFALSLDRV
jgi:hypothetical protein